MPVVASPVGVNAQYVRNAVTGFLAGDLLQWADLLAKLIKDYNLRKKMGEENRAIAKDFDIKIIGEKLIKLIMSA